MSGKAQRSLRGDGALPGDDRGDAVGRHAQRQRERVGGEAKRFKEVMAKYLTGMHWRQKFAATHTGKIDAAGVEIVAGNKPCFGHFGSPLSR